MTMDPSPAPSTATPCTAVVDVPSIVRGVLDQLEGKSTGPIQSAELPYDAWRKLCQRAATEPLTAATIITTILLLRPNMQWQGRRQQPAAHQLVAELVLALSSSTLGSIASTAALQPVLSATSTALISSSQQAPVEQGMQVLKALITSSTVFCQYIAGHDGVVSALANALRNVAAHSHEPKTPWSTLGTACEENMEHLLTTTAATAAFLQALSRVISGASTAATGAGIISTTKMSVRVYNCYVLEALLCARPATCMHAAGVAAMKGSPQLVQDVLRLLVDLQAAHAAQAVEASTGAAALLQLAAGQPAQAAAAKPAQAPQAPQASTHAALTAPGSAGTSGTSAAACSAGLPAGASSAASNPLPAHSPALRAAAEKVAELLRAAAAAQRLARQSQVAQSASAPVTTATSAATPTSPQLSGAGGDTIQARHVKSAHPPILFAVIPASPASASKAAPAPRPASTSPTAAASAAPAQKPEVSTALVQRFLRVLASITEQQPFVVAGEMVASPDCLRVLVQLLQPSTNLVCSYQSANIITACLCCEDLHGRDAVGFMDLFRGTPGALAAITGLLEGYKPPRPLTSEEAWRKAQMPSSPGPSPPKLNFTTLIKGLQAIVKHDLTKHADTPSTRNSGDNNTADSPSGSGVSAPGTSTGWGATTASPAPGGLAAWLTAKPNFIASLQGLMHRTNAGLLALLLHLLYPVCSPVQQRAFVRQVEKPGSFIGTGKKQYVNHLAELLEYPAVSESEVQQLPAAAHMLLQIVSTFPQYALKATYHKKAPGALSPGRLGSPNPNSAPADEKPSDGINSVVSGLLAAVQIRQPVSSTAAALTEAAGYAAEALVILACNPVCSEQLSHPAAVQQLMQLVAAAGQSSSWECLQDSTLSGQYRQVLLKIPYAVCNLALLQPGVPPMLEQHPGAVSTLAAALVSNQSHTASVQPKVLQAATQLLKQWPMLKQAIEAATHQQEEQQSQPSQGEGPSHLLLRQERQQEPGSPPRQHRLAAVPEDVSLCEWSPVRPGCPADGEDVQDTAGSQHSQDPTHAVPSLGDGLAADALVFVVPGSGSRLTSAAKGSQGLAFWGSGVKQQHHSQAAEGPELLLEAEQPVGEQPQVGNQGPQFPPLLSGFALRQQQQHAETHHGPSTGAAQLRDMSVHTPFFGGFMLSPQPPQQHGLDWCASEPAAAARAPAQTPAAAAAAAAPATSAAPEAAAAPSVCTTTHGTAGSSRNSGWRAGLHSGLAAMLTPNMFASAMDIDLPTAADEDVVPGEPALQPAAVATSSVHVAPPAPAGLPEPAAVRVDTANHGLQGNRASGTSGQAIAPVMHANLVAMLSPAAGAVLAQDPAPAAAASSAQGSALPPTMALPPAAAANPGAAPAATAAAASALLKRRRHYRSSKQRQDSASDPSASDSDSPPAKRPAYAAALRASTDAAGSSGMHPAQPLPQQQAVAKLQQPQQLHPTASEKPSVAVPQQEPAQPQQQPAKPQQQPTQQAVEEDELIEIQGPSDDSSDDSDSGTSPAATGSGSARRKHRHPYEQVWTASQAPKVQNLMAALGFGSSSTTPSDAKAMLRESIHDGEIFYKPHRSFKHLPESLRQAAKGGRNFVAAHMKRSDMKKLGAVWGYGWGKDRESAEVMAAEAAVANMYVCGVAFKQLPSYDGREPQ